jgi:hypothetical protein
VTNVPCAVFWKELIVAYPNANAVLTLETPQKHGTIPTPTPLTTPKPLASKPFVTVLLRLFLPSHGFDRLMKYQILYTPRSRFEAEGREWYEQQNAAVTEGKSM